MEEVWKPVVDYEGYYEVSNLGRVRSVPRKVHQVNRWGKEMQRTLPGKILKANQSTKWGHRCVTLCKKGKEKRWLVHRLVLEVFVGPCPEGLECLHGDGDPTNNRVDNLRWGTHKENAADSIRHGTNGNARKTHCNHGHGFTPENTYVCRDGYRYCRTCRRLRARKYYQRNIAE